MSTYLVPNPNNCFWYCLKPGKTEWQIKEIQLSELKRLPSFHDITEKLTHKPWLIIVFCIKFCKITTRFLFYLSLMAKSNCNMVLNPHQKSTLVLNIQLGEIVTSFRGQRKVFAKMYSSRLRRVQYLFNIWVQKKMTRFICNAEHWLLKLESWKLGAAT